MSQYERPAVLNNRRRKPAPGAPGIMPIGELARNPVEFTVRQLAEQVLAMTGSRSRIVFRELPIDGWPAFRVRLTGLGFMGSPGCCMV